MSKSFVVTLFGLLWATVSWALLLHLQPAFSPLFVLTFVSCIVSTAFASSWACSQLDS